MKGKDLEIVRIEEISGYRSSVNEFRDDISSSEEVSISIKYYIFFNFTDLKR